jgi:hypothetical protein
MAFTGVGMATKGGRDRHTGTSGYLTAEKDYAAMPKEASIPMQH